MSEPIKRPHQTPESYTPKEKPEIIHMAQAMQARKPYEVKAANGGSYIDGVPTLQYGQFTDCTYAGCMALWLRAMGVEASYEQLAGLAGSCYRLSMCYGWDPGSVIVNTSYCYQNFRDACGTDYNVNRAFGYEFYSVKNAAERDIQVQKSIAEGMPVLALGSRAVPEWCLVTGYEGDGDEVKYFGRSYFDGDAPEGELFTENRYTLADHYPGESPGLFVKLCGGQCATLPAQEALKCSLETCLQMFTPRRRWKHRKLNRQIGYGAYRFMINSLQKGDYYESMWMHFSNLLDARRAAHVYLADSAKLLSGENRARLLRAAALYREMFDMLSAVLPYERLYESELKELSPALRTDIILALHKMLPLEKQVRVLVREILRNWESYSPKERPEILRIAEEQAANRPIFYEMHHINGKLDSFETERLIIRHVRPEDWRDMQALAVSNNNSPYSDCDWLWPTDDEGVRKMCEPRNDSWAAEVKALSKVVCTIHFNGIGKDGKMDIGHVINDAYFGHGYEHEALAVLYDYCFRHYPAKAIIALWDMDNAEKLAPLTKLGMELVSTGKGKAWRPGADGVARDIEGCTAVITRDEWERANPASYRPKTMPEIVKLAHRQNRPATVEDLQAFVAKGGEPPRSNKIKKIRRLWHDLKCENFYLEGCFAAALQAAGDAPKARQKPPTEDTGKFPLAFGYTFLLTLSGTLFTQTWPSPTSSAGMSSELGHSIMPHMFNQLGWSYMYIDREMLEAQPGLAMSAIKASIKKKHLVISRGMGNVQLKERHFDRLPEWCLIGGYDRRGRLLVNVYPEDAVTDKHGYTAIADGLAGSDGLYILHKKQQGPDLAQLYKEALRAIPSLVKMPAHNGVSFGQRAYYDWADALLDDNNFANLADGFDGFLWHGYMAPWIVALTNECYIRRFFDQVIAESGLPEAAKVKEIYSRIHADLFKMQELHGGDFDAKPEVMAKREVREALAGILRRMGDLHEELLELFT